MENFCASDTMTRALTAEALSVSIQLTTDYSCPELLRGRRQLMTKAASQRFSKDGLGTQEGSSRPFQKAYAVKTIP